VGEPDRHPSVLAGRSPVGPTPADRLQLFVCCRGRSVELYMIRDCDSCVCREYFVDRYSSMPVS